MITDANESTEEGVIMPSTGSGEGIEPTLDAQSTSTPSVEPEENQEKKSRDFQSRYNQQTKRAYTAERENAELKAKLQEADNRQTTYDSNKAQDLVAPTLPEDIYDEESMRKYHTDSQAFNTQTAQGAAKSQYETQQQATAQKALDTTHQTNLDSYTKNATRDGVDFDKLLVAEKNLKDGGLKQELGSFLLNDVNGAKIVEYLSDNPAEMHEILALDPVSAGIRIANEIKPKALSQTPKVSGAPDPIPEVNGNGGYRKVDDFAKNYPGAEII